MAVKKLLPRIPLPRTLRGRLIAGLVALLAIGCATVGLVTYFAVQRALSGGLNNELQTATQLAYKCWEPQPGSGTDGDNGTGDNTQPAGQGSTPESGHAGRPQPEPRARVLPGDHRATSVPANPISTSIPMSCTGLAEQTFVAFIDHGLCRGAFVGGTPLTLSPADKQSLLSIKPAPDLPPASSGPAKDVPTVTRYLNVGRGHVPAYRDP